MLLEEVVEGLAERNCYTAAVVENKEA